LKKPELRPFPGQEPKRIKSDLTVFDRCNVTRRAKLFDEELPSTVEERPERQPYTLRRRNRRLRPFRSPAGVIVLRRKGGRGFTPIYAPWSPVGLARVRGTVVKVADGWAPYPQLGAAREPGPGPYVLRAIAELAMDGKDIAGTKHPFARDYADWVVRGNQAAQQEVQREESSIGPSIADESGVRVVPVISFAGELTETAVPANDSLGLLRYRIELDERKRLGRERAWVPGMEIRVDLGRKAKTSEKRNETSGEYGPETKLTPDGRVVFGKRGLAVLNSAGVSTSDIKGYGSKRRVLMKGGCKRTVDGQQSPDRRKPGRKPAHGFALSARLRKVKQRCKQRGLPFVIEMHVREKEPA
jgi:hypothetical protein